MHSYGVQFERDGEIRTVLILVVMEDALVQGRNGYPKGIYKASLNPCCNGRCTRTDGSETSVKNVNSLNPCCNGRCTRT